MSKREREYPSEHSKIPRYEEYNESSKIQRMDYKNLEYQLVELLGRYGHIYEVFVNRYGQSYDFHTINGEAFRIYGWNKSINCVHKETLESELDPLGCTVYEKKTHETHCRLVIRFKRTSGTYTELFTGINHFFAYSFDTGIVSLNDIPKAKNPYDPELTSSDKKNAYDFIEDLEDSRTEKLAIYYKLLEMEILIAINKIRFGEILSSRGYKLSLNANYIIDEYNIAMRRFIYNRLFEFLNTNYIYRTIDINHDFSTWEFGQKRRQRSRSRKNRKSIKRR